MLSSSDVEYISKIDKDINCFLLTYDIRNKTPEDTLCEFLRITRIPVPANKLDALMTYFNHDVSIRNATETAAMDKIIPDILSYDIREIE